MIQTSSPKIASSKIVGLLGDKAEYLLSYKSNTIDRSQLHLPSADHVDKIWTYSNRNNQVLRSMEQLLNTGALRVQVIAVFFLLTRVLNIAPEFICT